MVHTRFNGIAIANYPVWMRKAYDTLAPGGWLEMVDHDVPPRSDDGTLPEESYLVRFYRLLIEASRKTGRDLNVSHRWKQLAQDTGFVDVSERLVKVPLGGWAKDRRLKETGVFCVETVKEGMQAFGLKFLTLQLGWSVEEAEVMFAHVRKELEDRKVHAYLAMYVPCQHRLLEDDVKCVLLLTKLNRNILTAQKPTV
jgi:hypothetical protein